ncbi:MAG TPA: YCF48-related protein, partial [Hymenobacter sp.]
PGFLLHSPDNGNTWTSRDLRPFGAQYILDIKMFTPREGFLCAGSDMAVEKSNALILYTSDGGQTWQKRYQSTRPFEITWKQSWPSRKVGYVTVQSYNPDTLVAQRYVAKTTNGGKSWKEIPLVKNAKVREFGVGFADDKTGWVGAMPHGFGTRDGGRTWEKVDFGNAVNKIRLIKTPDGGYVAYAIGVNVYKLAAPK